MGYIALRARVTYTVSISGEVDGPNKATSSIATLEWRF